MHHNANSNESIGLGYACGGGERWKNKERGGHTNLTSLMGTNVKHN